MLIKPNKIILLTFRVKILKSEMLHNIKSFVKRIMKFIQPGKNIKMKGIGSFIQ